MKPLRACRLMVTDSNHFDEDPGPDPHKSEKLDPDKQ
jgi:hypothetical protein